MIEYILISSILIGICEVKKKTWEYLREDTRLVPLWHLLEIKTWGTKWKGQLTK
jgi:hypothetical protein